VWPPDVKTSVETNQGEVEAVREEGKQEEEKQVLHHLWA